MYLLDDPISNIDTEVSNNIFKNAFINFVFKINYYFLFK